jgi:hypothetical protein
LSGQHTDPAVAQTIELRPRPIPEPTTDEDLASLSAHELRERLAQISAARQRSSLDAATKDRLKKDFDRVLARIKRGSAAGE